MKVGVCGGFGEVGKNMTYVESGGEIVILDMGLFLPAIINLEEEERLTLSAKKLLQIGAIPDDSYLRERKEQVKAIVLGHCHLDHIGGVPHMSKKYNCPVIGTPYTLEVLKSMLRDDYIEIPNELKAMNVNSSIRISENIKIEFINITHSTLQCVFVAVHTKEGIVLYANDFKFDRSPTLGKEPNFKRLRELKGKVKVLIVESLYADRDGKTPSETVAKEMLKDVLLGTDNKGCVVFVTTFASHIPRLKAILEYGKRMRRKVVFLGRSMGKYINAAEKLGLINFRKSAEIIVYRKKIGNFLRRIIKNKGDYIVICTGSQGEPKSVLDRIVNKEFDFKLMPDDHVIFSCKTIPEPINIANRELMENKLKRDKVRIFTEIHVSGHASREDLRDLIKMTRPKNIIPAHGDSHKMASLASLAVECDYKIGRDIHILYDGQSVEV
jgi:ribonuclease J